ncbi:MAG: hypothetical protein KDD69_03080 [Bdellovibrionales bacterium]|nr:hypothetical protein [Bdellovibrionales bacterium]
MVEVASLILIILYFLALKAIAWLCHRKSSHTQEDFFLGGRIVSGPLLWATVLATAVNSLAYTAVPGLVYQGGVLFVFMWAVVIGLALCIRFLGPLVASYARFHHLISQGELFGHYYSSRSIQNATGLLAIAAALPFMCVQLNGMAKIAHSATAGVVSYELALLLLAAYTGVYIFYGGARAVIATDLVQATVFTLLLLFTACLFTYWIGGFSQAFGAIRTARPELLHFNATTLSACIDNAVSWPLAFFLWPQLFQRMLMAKDEPSIRETSRATLWLFGFTMSLIMTIGIMITAEFITEARSPDTLVAEMFRRHWPAGSSVVVLAVIALGMSTLDSGLLALSSIVSRDLLRTSDYSFSRRCSLVLLVVVTLLAASETGRGALAPMVSFGASLAALLIWPVLGMTFLPGLTSRQILLAYTCGASAIASSIFGPAFGPGILGMVGGMTGIALGWAMDRTWFVVGRIERARRKHRLF